VHNAYDRARSDRESLERVNTGRRAFGGSSEEQRLHPFTHDAQAMADQVTVEQTAWIVTAFVSRNALSTADLPAVIATVHEALLAVRGRGAPEPEAAKPPAVSVRRSIQPDHLVCLEDGLKYVSLKRHLRTVHNLTPDGYRAKWCLPDDYPMVAPSYSKRRSSLAKVAGLGSHSRRTDKR